MGEKMSKAMIDDLISKGATVGKSTAEALDGQMMVELPVKPFIPPREDGCIAGIWTLRIPNWCPTPLNKILYGKHWSDGARRKKSDGEIIAHYGRGVPKASQKRAVSLHVVFPPGKRMPDVDAYWKSALDSLVACGILVNDTDAWAVMHPVDYSRGKSLVTFITIEDV